MKKNARFTGGFDRWVTEFLADAQTVLGMPELEAKERLKMEEACKGLLQKKEAVAAWLGSNSVPDDTKPRIDALLLYIANYSSVVGGLIYKSEFAARMVKRESVKVAQSSNAKKRQERGLASPAQVLTMLASIYTKDDVTHPYTFSKQNVHLQRINALLSEAGWQSISNNQLYDAAKALRDSK